MKRLFVATALVASLALSGCETLQNFIDSNGGTAELGVTYATLKYIGQAGDEDKQIARAVKVRMVVEDVRAAAHGDDVTIGALQAYVMAKLPADLDPADRYLASALVGAVVAELEERVGTGVLDPEQLLAVDEVLDWIASATAYYAPAPA